MLTLSLLWLTVHTCMQYEETPNFDEVKLLSKAKRTQCFCEPVSKHWRTQATLRLMRQQQRWPGAAAHAHNQPLSSQRNIIQSGTNEASQLPNCITATQQLTSLHDPIDRPKTFWTLSHTSIY